MKRTNVPHLLKTLGYFESLVSINLLSVLLIVLDETVRRSANKQENLRLFLKKKKCFIPRGDQEACYSQVLEWFYYHRKKTNRLVLFTHRNLYRFHTCFNRRWGFLTITIINCCSQMKNLTSRRLPNWKFREWEVLNSIV